MALGSTQQLNWIERLTHGSGRLKVHLLLGAPFLISCAVLTRIDKPASWITARIKRVKSFQELIATPFAEGVNALCWERSLPGDFGEIVKLLGAGEEMTTLNEAQLLDLPASKAGRIAIDVLLEDYRLLQDHGLAPVLNCIQNYPRDENPGPVPTDVFSFHADSATVETDTYLCTYHGALVSRPAQRRGSPARGRSRNPGRTSQAFWRE